jgi:hypothetical protein
MGFPRLVSGNETESYRTQASETQPTVGTKMAIEDGRTFRRVENGGVAAVNARVFMSVAPSANFRDEAVGATVAAGETILPQVGSTSGNGAASLFKNGYLFVTEIAQLDPVHRIKDNTLITASATSGTITLYNPLLDEINVTETITYVENPFRNIVVGLASAYTAPPVGVIVTAIALDEYGWIATGGPTKVLYEDTIIIGAGVSISTTNDAGAVVAWVPETATTVNNMPIGSAMTVQADAEKGIVFLRLEN